MLTFFLEYLGWLIKEMGFEEDDLERIRSNLRVVSA